MGVKKIFFYLDNSKIKNADLRYPEEGNPGVGGTQYYFVALPYYIHKYKASSYDVYILAHFVELLPSNLKCIEVNGIDDVLKISNSLNPDFLIIRPLFDESFQKFYSNLSSSRIKCIMWGHNMLNYSQLKTINDIEQIVAYVCVSREQSHRLCDHDVSIKSTYIFNPFGLNSFPSSQRINNNFVVTYIGALVKSKGFHKLAEIWPEIVKKIPQAKLNVIGSGSLYDEKSKLGLWGVADENYEKKIRKHLSNKKGNVIDSVIFHGKLGKEKIQIFNETRVGVPNPTGRTENCPGSALEFQACFIPVVSAKKFGLLDTVKHGNTGLLYNSKKSQTKAIINLLENEQLASEMGVNARDFVSKTFNPKKIVNKWHLLFKGIDESSEVFNEKINKNLFHNYKIVRMFIKYLRFNLGLKFIPPLIKLESDILNLARSLKKIKK